MKNQKIYLKHLLNGVGFISLFLIFSEFEAKANSINDSQKNSFGSEKIKWIKADGFGKIKEKNTIKKITERKEETDKALIVKAEKEAERKEKKIIKKITELKEKTDKVLIVKADEEVERKEKNIIKKITERKEETDKVLIVKAEEEAERKEKNAIKKVTQQNNQSNQPSSFPLGKQRSENIFLANNEIEENKENVLISEIIIEGWENHPEGRKLELAAYDSMTIKPGSIINNKILKNDLNSIYASGWFSGVKIKSEDGPLGVRLIVTVVPNPILKEVKLNPKNTIIPNKFVDDIFTKDYGTTLNLNELQNRINTIKKWYEEKGYSLSRINGPERISGDGILSLNVDEGIVSDIELRFLGSDGEPFVDGKPRKGKTKDWVIKRELLTAPGAIFNRKILEADIKRLYSTSLFDDVKVSLAQDKVNPEKVIIILDLSEQRTGSLTGGLGYSNSSGIFAQVGLQETNAFGRAWSTSLNLGFGEYSTTYNFSLSDPWIKSSKDKLSFRTNAFLSRNYPQEFKSENNGRLYAVDDQNSTSSDSFSSVVLEKSGGGFAFSKPLNGGDPFKKAKWKVLSGMNFKKVSIIDSDGIEKPFGTRKPTTANLGEIICLGFKPNPDYCPEENVLVSVIGSATMNNLNNPVNPTSGNKFSIGTEQFFRVGHTSPTFNRTRASYSFFIPTKLINLTKECKSSDSVSSDCPQTIGFELKAGTIIGQLPPYEAFCMGGSSSVRGWASCDLSVSKTFVEATAEYRLPIWKMISGAIFADAGTDLGSQSNVSGKPGKLLQKPGSGFSLGAGAGIKTPIGPLRLDAASKDLSGDWRYTLGVGWKF